MTVMARAAKKVRRPPPRRRKGGTTRFLLFVVASGVLAIPTPATVILVIGQRPTFVAYLIDREPEGYASITVGGANFAAIVPYLMAFWVGPHSINSALAVILDLGLTGKGAHDGARKWD